MAKIEATLQCFHELQRQQDVIRTEIRTEIFEEDGSKDDVFASHDRNTDYYHGFKKRGASQFIFRRKVCTYTDWKFKKC